MTVVRAVAAALGRRVPPGRLSSSLLYSAQPASSSETRISADSCTSRQPVARPAYNANADMRSRSPTLTVPRGAPRGRPGAQPRGVSKNVIRGPPPARRSADAAASNCQVQWCVCNCVRQKSGRGGECEQVVEHPSDQAGAS